jgi:hypothetical protein
LACKEWSENICRCHAEWLPCLLLLLLLRGVFRCSSCSCSLPWTELVRTGTLIEGQSCC